MEVLNSFLPGVGEFAHKNCLRVLPGGMVRLGIDQYIKTKELLRFRFGCHGIQGIIAMRYYVADAYCPKEAPYQIWT